MGARSYQQCRWAQSQTAVGESLQQCIHQRSGPSGDELCRNHWCVVLVRLRRRFEQMPHSRAGALVQTMSASGLRSVRMLQMRTATEVTAEEKVGAESTRRIVVAAFAE